MGADRRSAGTDFQRWDALAGSSAWKRSATRLHVCLMVVSRGRSHEECLAQGRGQGTAQISAGGRLRVKPTPTGNATALYAQLQSAATCPTTIAARTEGRSAQSRLRSTFRANDLTGRVSSQMPPPSQSRKLSAALRDRCHVRRAPEPWRGSHRQFNRLPPWRQCNPFALSRRSRRNPHRYRRLASLSYSGMYHSCHIDFPSRSA
jgi:hypothetical protein